MKAVYLLEEGNFHDAADYWLAFSSRKAAEDYVRRRPGYILIDVCIPSCLGYWEKKKGRWLALYKVPWKGPDFCERHR